LADVGFLRTRNFALRRATGVTTAVALITAIELCLGGGQIVIGPPPRSYLVVLAPLRQPQIWMSCEKKSSVTIKVSKGDAISDDAAALPTGSTVSFSEIAT